MNYNTLKQRLVNEMHSYLLYMLEIKDPDEIEKIHAELHRIKSRIEEIDRMSGSRRHEQVETIIITIESRMKHLK